MSTIHTMQVGDYSPYLQQLSDAKKKKNKAALQAAYENSLAAIQAEEMGLEEGYRKGKNAAAATSAQEGRNFAQYAAAQGLGSGASGQAELARSITLQNHLNDLTAKKLDRQSSLALQRAAAERDYESGLAAAEADAEADLAEELYKEKVRQEKMDFDIRKYWYDNDITPAPVQGGQSDLSAVAQQVLRGQWGNGAERKNRLSAAGYDYAAVQALVESMLAGK